METPFKGKKFWRTELRGNKKIFWDLLESINILEESFPPFCKERDGRKSVVVIKDYSSLAL